MNTAIYSILVRNLSGASEGTTGTQAQIDLWLSNWQDPENLSATITDEHGEVVATKPRGEKEIVW